MESWRRGKLVLMALFGAVFQGSCASSLSRMDAVSAATASAATESAAADRGEDDGSAAVRIVLASSLEGSTGKIAAAISSILDAPVLSLREAEGTDLSGAGILGFGSGILDQAHHGELLAFVDALPQQGGRKAFIFSTSGVSRDFAIRHDIDDPHTALRDKLREKGFDLVGEFNCPGFNANSFLKFFGGMNRGRPNGKDIRSAEDFARSLL